MIPLLSLSLLLLFLQLKDRGRRGVSPHGKLYKNKAAPTEAIKLLCSPCIKQISKLVSSIYIPSAGIHFSLLHSFCVKWPTDLFYCSFYIYWESVFSCFRCSNPLTWIRNVDVGSIFGREHVISRDHVHFLWLATDRKLITGDRLLQELFTLSENAPLPQPTLQGEQCRSWVWILTHMGRSRCKCPTHAGFAFMLNSTSLKSTTQIISLGI